LLPTKVSEEDLIKPQHNDMHEKVGLLSPDNSSEDHIVDFDQAWSNNWDTEGEQNVNQNSSQITPVDKIEQYRSEICRQKSKPVDATEVEPDINFFAEMEPENIAQAKVFVGGNGSNNGHLSERKNRLSVSMSEQVPEEKSNVGDPMLMNWGEVAEIDEAVGGWDPEEDDITDVLKEHRRMRKKISK